MNIVERARELAQRAHAGQRDKAGRPYIEHVARVAAACADDPAAEAVAWLHDVAEDHPAHRSVIVNTMPYRVWRAVDLLDRSASPRHLYYIRIRCNPLALRVKLADITDNCDEARLALLEVEAADRLRRKYSTAMAALTV